MRKSLFIILLFSKIIHAQVIDSQRGNSESSGKEFKPVSTSFSALEKNVDLFTGVFNSAYDLGSVNTLEGLRFTLKMKYASSFSGGDNVPVASGIPYGEGWSLDIPSITVSTEAFHNYSEAEELQFDKESGNGIFNRKNLTAEQLLTEGKVYWFAPLITIPGLISERFVFKYLDESDNRAVFVPHKFERYVEARFDGQFWEVSGPDGTVWRFDIAQANTRNPSNQRIHNNGMAAYEMEVMNNLYVPKMEVLAWYCSQVWNPTHSAGQKIYFEYEKFGEFNFFAEYQDSRTSGYILEQFTDTHKLCVPWVCNCVEYAPAFRNFTTYRDIFLRRVSAASYTTVIEELTLDYRTVDARTLGVVNLLLPGDQDVHRKDSLYNYKAVFSSGIGSNSISSYDTEESILHSTGISGFSNWSRYMHIKADESALPGMSTDNNDFSSDHDPYLVHMNGSDAYCRILNPPAINNDLPFDHGFLESPRIETDGNLELPSGDLYEIKALIRNDEVSTDPGAGFCNFDINVISGDERTSEINATSLAGVDRPKSNTINDSKDFEVYSTFNQPIKWNSRSSLNTNHPGYLLTSNFFVLPKLPAEFEGFQIQIGPANSDHKFSIESSNVNAYSSGSNIAVAAAPRAYYSNLNSSFNTDLYPTSPMPHNFGAGLPWKVMERFYAVFDDGDLSYTAPRNRHWWKGGSIPVSWSNSPTLANENVYLAGLALLRYSKNPYMLSSVTKFRTNGDVTPFDSPGKIPVSRIELTYNVKVDTLLNNVKLSPGQEPAQPYYGLHNTFLLERLINVPTNPSRPGDAVAFNLLVLPSVRFEYDQKRNSDYGQTRDNKFLYPLAKITDHLGGICLLTYSDFGPGSFNTGVIRYKRDAKNILSDHSVVETRMAVVNLKEWKGDGLYANWDYSYGNQIRQLTDPGDPVKSNIKEFFYKYLTNSNTGFQTVTVTGPANGSGERNYSVYTNFGLSNPLLFGKLKAQSNYNALGQKISESEYIYKEDLAFKNGTYRSDPLKNANEEYSDITYSHLNSSLLISPPAYNVPIRIGDELISSFEISHGRAYPENYLNSYFIPVSRVIERVYQNESDVSIYDAFESPSLSGFIFSLSNSLETQKINCEGPSMEPICLTKVKSYSYWDASCSGVTTSPGYKLLIPEFTASSYQLSFEPSWELFSVREHSPDLQGGFKKQEFFTYFDLKNFDGGLEHPDFPAVHKSRLYNLRNLNYEERLVTANPGTDSVSVSNYTFFRDRWNPNLEDLTTPVVINFDGPLYCPTGQGGGGSGSGSGSGGSGTIGVPEECYRALNASSAPPLGYELRYYNSIAYFCPEDIIASERDNNADASARMILFNQDPELPNVGHWLSGKLKYSHSVKQAGEVLKASYSSQIRKPKNGILSFSRNETEPEHYEYLPCFPYDTLLVDSIIQRSEYGQIKLKREANGLLTQFNFVSPTLLIFNDVSDPCNNYTGMSWNNIFNPVSVIRGFGLSNYQQINYTWNPDYSLSRDTSNTGQSHHYTYDEFGRTNETWEGERLLSSNSYSNFYDEDFNTFAGRSNQNFHDSWTWTDQDSVIHSRKFQDPAGRNVMNVTCYGSSRHDVSDRMILSGEIEYDLLDRVSKEFKPFEFVSSGGAPVSMFPRYNRTLDLDNRPYMGFSYNDRAGGALEKESSFGESIDTGHVKQTIIKLINWSELMSELQLTVSERSLLFGNTNGGLFIKRINIDEDGKKQVIYNNPLGTTIAEKRYVSRSVPVILLYSYDAFGNVSRVIHPDKSISNFRTNLLGLVIEKSIPGLGRRTYMFDRSGNIVLTQDENGRAGIDNSNLPYCRKYNYDLFNRLISVERMSITDFDPIAYLPDPDDPVYSPNLANSCFWIFKKTVLLPGGFQVSYGADHFLETAGIEKELIYDDKAVADLNDHTVLLTSDIAEKLFTDQHFTRGRLSQVKCYGQSGQLQSISYLSYNPNGTIEMEVQQFNESGITSGNIGLFTIISYPQYNYLNDLKRIQVDVDHDDYAELDIAYEYFASGKLQTVTVNGAKMRSFRYRQADGMLIGSVNYRTNSKDCENLPVDSTMYEYDVRNRLTDLRSRFFEESLYYDLDRPSSQISTARVRQDFNFNGEINASEVKYLNLPSTVTNFTGKTVYGYKYDQLGRLIVADASIYDNINSGTTLSSPKLRYGDESFVYDPVSNISSLKRYRFYPYSNPSPANSSIEMNYVYDNLKRLNRIDSSGIPNRSYHYDLNGNMRTDSYREIVMGKFNSFDLPEELAKSGELYQYAYNEQGQRIFKGRTNGDKEFYLRSFNGDELGVYYISSADWTFYVNGNGKVGRIHDGEPEFFVPDHLGNTRLVYKANVNCPSPIEYYVRSIFDYYPGGKVLRSFEAGVQEKYLTTEHERDKESGLDYRNARFSDADIVMFRSGDPLAEKFPGLSGYNYLAGNPVRFTDPDGKEPNEYNINRVTGSVDKVSNKGGDETDFYNIGTVKNKGEFDVDNSIEIDRGENIHTINMFRLETTSNSTTSVFHVPSLDIKGFMLEPAGPCTSIANQDKRIPDGQYTIARYSSAKFPDNFIISNSVVSRSRRILIHKGVNGDSTLGCLIPGTTRTSGSVWESDKKFKEVKPCINEYGPNNFKLNIYEFIK